MVNYVRNLVVPLNLYEVSRLTCVRLRLLAVVGRVRLVALKKWVLLVLLIDLVVVCCLAVGRTLVVVLVSSCYLQRWGTLPRDRGIVLAC